ncbi:MAG TPA: divalent-cation tolerance protein CutA [Acidobacteriota bacterium]|jgi:periplasmic divalent cation tolerance protein
MTDFSVVLTTVNSEEEARKLAQKLVETRLAACVNIIPDVVSVYNWKDKLQQDKEWLLLIKTRSDLTARIGEIFRRNHPYDLPELVEIKIEHGSAAYLSWLGEWLIQDG